MLTLSLLRHAEATTKDQSGEDFDRELTSGGETAARSIGRWMARRGIIPDLILSSDAERARATCRHVGAAFEVAPPITYDGRLYLASPRALLARVRQVPSDVRHLMLVGHNPGLHALATSLVGSGPADLRARLDEDFPTAALAVLASEASRFADLEPGTAQLVEFVMPRRLSPSDNLTPDT